MEVDSMHSVIERAKKHRQIYSPTEWPTLIRNAKMTKPFVVTTLDFNMIINLKKLFDDTTSNDLKTNTKRETVPWMKIKWLKFCKAEGNIITYGTDFEQTNLNTIDITDSQRRKKKRPTPMNEAVLTPKYTAPLEISESKRKDLIKLCDAQLIPRE